MLEGLFTAGYPGQKTFIAYNILQPEYNERVFFAGEHASATHAWIQGALLYGKFTANNLAKHAMKHKSK